MHIINNSRNKEKTYRQEEYIKEINIKDKTQEELNSILIKSIIKTNKDLQNARCNFEFAEGELIDYYLYQMKANQSKLNYLIKKSKANNIKIDRINQIEIENSDNINVI